ncbi:hypothetical protein ASG87_16715 [Frateuria sp. Soil773]|nr:hypothetical protein ASG87_16715 [Frateuria sp. Soil773]
MKRYLREMLPPLFLLLAVTVAMAVFARHLGTAARVGLLAVLACDYGWLGWVEFRHVRRCDELRQRLELESMMLAFIASLGMVFLLFLANSLKLAAVPFRVAPLVMVGCYLVCNALARLRYRYWVLA